ncbi:MAG: anthranilate phosphoribosyltransferase [Gammaproteobacteria bacterium]|nr:MAG: anthranilate phosphoribosyltransferase [Gammaproteobacteria bacterium]
MPNKTLEKLYAGNSLSREESYDIFSKVITGTMDSHLITSLLIALKIKGETPLEISGAVQALKENAILLPTSNQTISDSCGTGGSGKNTINISTMVAFVLAEYGLAIAKHGNRSISSQCGSADVLESLGININLTPEQADICLHKTNFTFLFAPDYHPGVKHVMPVRNTLQTRTIFNLLGPLINPASPKYQLMGIYSKDLCFAAAESLRLSGCLGAMVVNSGGYDEITLHNETNVAELSDGVISEYQISHKDFGLPKTESSHIAGQAPDVNKQILEDVLSGNISDGKNRSIAYTISANASALLKINNKVDSLKEGAELIMNLLETGKCMAKVNQVAKLTQEYKLTQEACVER